MRKPHLIVAAVYAATALALWPMPLLGLLHAESSAVVAGVGFFASGWAALALFRGGGRLGPVLLRLEALLALPWALLTLSLLWRPNCGYLQGLLLFLLFAPPSVALAVALAYALDAAQVRARSLVFALIGTTVAVLPPLYDLGLHPQFYTYNHVWGGVLGPIYDEELALRPGLFVFRLLTLLWAVWLGLIGRRAVLRRRARGGEGVRQQHSGVRSGAALLGVTLLIGTGYALGPWLGFTTPGWLTRAHLGGHLATEHFDIYYDPGETAPGRLALMALTAEYRWTQLAAVLGVAPEEKIGLYLYPDTETKAALTGAAETSVTPVWLPTPQAHLLTSAFDATFAHELVHVFSREFGLPVLRASPSVGLVEGLAVALEPPDGRPPPHQQVAAAVRLRDELGTFRQPLAEAVAELLGPLGFWTGRGAVSYTTMGSFVAWLIAEHGAEPFRAVYARGDFERVYGQPVAELAAAWQRFILALPPDAEAEAVVRRRFTRPSLFEQRCPHYVEPAIRLARAAAEALEDEDAARAYALLTDAVAADSTEPAVLAAWGRLALAAGDTELVLRRLEAAATQADTLGSAALWSRLGDAYRLAGEEARADSAYVRARSAYPPYAQEGPALVRLRAALTPEALGHLLAGAPPAARAAALEAVAAPPAQVTAALLWAEAEDFSRAQAVLEAVRPQDLPEAVRPVRLAWLARFAALAGDAPRAAGAASGAARAYAAAGATGAALEMQDLETVLWWWLLRQDSVLTPH